MAYDEMKRINVTKKKINIQLTCMSHQSFAIIILEIRSESQNPAKKLKPTSSELDTENFLPKDQIQDHSFYMNRQGKMHT